MTDRPVVEGAEQPENQMWPRHIHLCLWQDPTSHFSHNALCFWHFVDVYDLDKLYKNVFKKNIFFLKSV